MNTDVSSLCSGSGATGVQSKSSSTLWNNPGPEGRRFDFIIRSHHEKLILLHNDTWSKAKSVAITNGFVYNERLVVSAITVAEMPEIPHEWSRSKKAGEMGFREFVSTRLRGREWVNEFVSYIETHPNWPDTLWRLYAVLDNTPAHLRDAAKYAHWEWRRYRRYLQRTERAA